MFRVSHWPLLGGLGTGRKSAHGQYHAALGKYLAGLPAPGDLHTLCGALFDKQRFGGRLQPQVDAIGEGGGCQPCDQGIAHGQTCAPWMVEAIQGISAHQFQAVPERSRRALEAEEVLDVDAIDHHAAEQQHAVRGPLEVLEVLTQLAPVVLVDFQGATGLRAAGQIRVIVGRQWPHAVFELAVGLQET
ncbi:hypothetical protein D3C73_1284170 [compost metagenome]